MTVTIKTNNVPREMFYLFQLNDKDQKVIRKQFDYFNEEELDEQNFFKYKDYWYCLSDFLAVRDNDTFKGWDGYSSDSYFSGVLIKVREDYEVICGRFYS